MAKTNCTTATNNKQVICSNHGGSECKQCIHNTPHSPKAINPLCPRSCVQKFSYCTCAIDGGQGGQVQCFEV